MSKVEKIKIGVVGLGIMGRGITNNFLKHDHSVFVWNRTKAVAKEFEKKGAVVCDNPAEVAKQAEIVFEVTAKDESSKEVWLGKNGILEGANKKNILIASATLSIEWIDELIQKCETENLTFLDMALTGGRVGAETGALTLLCGGDEKVLKQIESDLQSIAQKILYFGKAGQGMRYKLILNFLQAIHIVGFGQAMKIAKAYKMDTKKVGEALADRPGGVITGLALSGYQQEPDPINFSVEWITKDLTYAKRMAKDLDLSLLKEVLAEYEKALKKGMSKKDWTSVNSL